MTARSARETSDAFHRGWAGLWHREVAGRPERSDGLGLTDRRHRDGGCDEPKAERAKLSVDRHLGEQGLIVASDHCPAGATRRAPWRRPTSARGIPRLGKTVHRDGGRPRRRARGGHPASSARRTEAVENRQVTAPPRLSRSAHESSRSLSSPVGGRPRHGRQVGPERGVLPTAGRQQRPGHRTRAGRSPRAARGTMEWRHRGHQAERRACRRSCSRSGGQSDISISGAGAPEVWSARHASRSPTVGLLDSSR